MPALNEVTDVSPMDVLTTFTTVSVSPCFEAGKSIITYSCSSDPVGISLYKQRVKLEAN